MEFECRAIFVHNWIVDCARFHDATVVRQARNSQGDLFCAIFSSCKIASLKATYSTVEFADSVIRGRSDHAYKTTE